MIKIKGVFGFTKYSKSVTFFNFLRLCHKTKQGDKYQRQVSNHLQGIFLNNLFRKRQASYFNHNGRLHGLPLRCVWFLQPLHKLIQWQWTADPVALKEINATITQPFGLLWRFYTFGYGQHIKAF